MFDEVRFLAPSIVGGGKALTQLGSDLVCDESDRDTQEASRHLVFAWFPISRGLILDSYLLGCYFWGVLKSNLNEGESNGSLNYVFI